MSSTARSRSKSAPKRRTTRAAAAPAEEVPVAAPKRTTRRAEPAATAAPVAPAAPAPAPAAAPAAPAPGRRAARRAPAVAGAGHSHSEHESWHEIPENCETWQDCFVTWWSRERFSTWLVGSLSALVYIFSLAGLVTAALGLTTSAMVVMGVIMAVILETIQLGGAIKFGWFLRFQPLDETKLVVPARWARLFGGPASYGALNFLHWVAGLAVVVIRSEDLWDLCTGVPRLVVVAIALLGVVSQWHLVFVYFQVYHDEFGLDLDGDGYDDLTGRKLLIPLTKEGIMNSGAQEWTGRAVVLLIFFTVASAAMFYLSMPSITVPLIVFLFFVATNLADKWAADDQEHVTATMIGEWVIGGSSDNNNNNNKNNGNNGASVGKTARGHKFLTALLIGFCLFINIKMWSASSLLPTAVTGLAKVFSTYLIPNATGHLSLSNLIALVGLVFAVGLLARATRMSVRSVVFLVVIPVAIIFGVYTYSHGGCQLVLGEEDPGMEMNRKAEAELVRFIEDQVWSRAAQGTADADRILHATPHACARAKVIVRPELHPQLRVGIFSRPGHTYDAYLRFSNGEGWTDRSKPPSPDSKPDVRGMTIKVTGVDTVPESERLLTAEEEQERRTQDFVLLSAPTFFTGDVQRYTALFKAVLSTRALLAFVFPSVNPFTWTVSPLLNALRMAKYSSTMTNPLEWTYHSTVPYRFGASRHTAVKYFARPCVGYPNGNVTLTDADKAADPRYLRTAVNRTLSEREACFELRAVRQVDACQQPIEDPTVPWGEETSDALATVIIPRQEVLRRDMMTFCENLSFNPWHGYRPHQPLGAVNKVRKLAYLAGSRARRDINRSVNQTSTFGMAEPTGKEEFRGEVLPTQTAGYGNPKDWKHAFYPSPVSHLPTHLATFPATTILENIKAVFWPPPADVPQQFDAMKIVRIVMYLLETQLTQYEFNRGNGKPYAQWTTPQDYQEIFGTYHRGKLPLPDIAKDGEWAKDTTFAWQYLRGLNPVRITNAHAKPLPAWVKPAHLEAQFAAWTKEKRLFYAEYSELEGIVAESGRIFYAPAVVFRLDKGDPQGTGQDRHPRLVPVLIQLGRGSQPLFPDRPDLTPPKAWQFAKMLVANADAIQHEMASHLCMTHLWIEPLVVSFYRQLKLGHPIMKLMAPHFRQTIAINNLGRLTLLAPTDSIIGNVVSTGITGALQYMAQVYNNSDFTSRAFPNDMKARGFEEVTDDSTDANNVLPGYFYRDDGFKLWRAIERYVKASLRVAELDTPERIAADVQLQALLRELRDPLIANVKGIPNIATIDDLTFFLTNIFFTATVQHSAVNFGQFDFYGFVPNRPLLLNRGMPHNLSTVNDAFIMSALPNLDKTFATVNILRIISLKAEEVIDPSTGKSLLKNLYETANADFPGPYAEFLEELRRIEQHINNRNQHWNANYHYLLPSQIASSIAI